MPATTDSQADKDARLLRLEEKVAYQDKMIAELNDVVVSLHRATDEVQSRLQTIERSLRSEIEARDVPNDKPPHY